MPDPHAPPDRVRCCGRLDTCQRDAAPGEDYCLPCLEAVDPRWYEDDAREGQYTAWEILDA